MAEPLSDLERMLLTPDPSLNAIQPKQAGGLSWTTTTTPATTRAHAQPEAPEEQPQTTLPQAEKTRRFGELTAAAEAMRNEPHWVMWLDEMVARYPDIRRDELSYCIGRFDVTALEPLENTPELVLADYRTRRPLDPKLAAKYAARDAKEKEVKERADSQRELLERRTAIQDSFSVAWQEYLSACADRRARFLAAEGQAEEDKKEARRKRDAVIVRAEEECREVVAGIALRLKQVLSEPPPVQPVKPRV
jgi:hypothetical protein